MIRLNLITEHPTLENVMKRIRLMTPTALAVAACLSVSPSAKAQVPVDTPVESEEVTPSASAKIGEYLVGSAEGLLIEDAVRQLLNKGSEDGIPMLNVLFDETARAALVPELMLRNVSVVDGLQLIAVAADCVLEPIASADTARVIGYRFEGSVARENSMNAMGGMWDGTTPGPAPSLSPVMPTDLPSPSHVSGNDLPASSGGGSVQAGAEAGSGGGRPPGGLGEVGAMVFTAPSAPGESAPEIPTAVYALGPVAGATKLEDIEQALQELLEMQGDGKNTATLRLHEATNTLIVRGKAAEHEVVTGMLSALSENQAVKLAAERTTNEDWLIQKFRQLEMEAGERMQQVMRLDERLAESEREKAELQKKVNELGMKLGKGSSSVDGKHE